jgi:hypothetical protein
MVQLDCGLVRTEGLAPPTVNGRTGLHGRKSLGRKEGFCVGGKGLCRKEGIRVVDGTEGSALDRRVCGRVWLTERKGLRLEEGRVQVLGKEIVADRCGKSGRIWTDLEAL